MAKNAKARASAAEKKVTLLEEFDKASSTATTVAKGKSSFTKQAAGVPSAIIAKVTSGRVDRPSTAATSASDSAGDNGSSDGLSDVGGDTYEPAAGEYVQVKMTSTSGVKGRIMQVHRVKGDACTLRQIGAANVPGAKKVTLGVKSLHDIRRSGVTVDIHLNAANLQDYLNLLVENPTLPAVPPPDVPEAPIPPTPATAVPEPQRLLMHSGVRRTSYPHDLAEVVQSTLPLTAVSSAAGDRPLRRTTPSAPEVPPTLPLTAVHGYEDRPLRRPSSSTSSAAAYSATPKPQRASSSSTANASFQSVTSLPATTPPPLPEGTAPGSFIASRVPSTSIAQKANPARASSTPLVPKMPPGKKVPPTTVDPRDPLFEPPTEGIAHYHDASGNVHVITAPGVSVPSSYKNVNVKTSEQAAAIHAAAQVAAATSAEATAAQTRLEARASTSTPAVSSVLLAEKEQYVLPKSLRTPSEQALAVKTIKALHDQVNCGQKQALANTQEINDLLAQVQELYGEKGQLAEERDQLMESNAQLCEERAKLAEQGRLEMELHQQPEAVAALEDVVARLTARCEQLQEQQGMSATVVDNANARVKKAEDIMNDALSSHSATREAAANLEENNAQLSRQLADADHRLQLQSERVNELTLVEAQVEELQAEHLLQLAAVEQDRDQQLAAVEQDRVRTDDEWHEVLDAAEAREAVYLSDAATAAEDCEEHKAQLQQQLMEARAVASALEKQLREFDETAAAVTAAAEAEHHQREARLQERLELQTDLLKKSDTAMLLQIHASETAAIASRVAALESQHFRNGGPHGGGTQPPHQGSRGSTAAAGMPGSMMHLQPFKSPPSLSGSDDSTTFVGRDGVPRHSSKGTYDVRITDAVEALKDRFLESNKAVGSSKVLSLRYVKVPQGMDPWEYLSKCRLDPWKVEKLYDGGSCSDAIKEALAFISPAAPYGGEGEPVRPAYAPEIKRMQKNADGSEEWNELSCLCCLHAPPWNTRQRPHPGFNTPEALMYRNTVSSKHNPHPCPARLLTALMTDCQPLIECIVPKPVPREL